MGYTLPVQITSMPTTKPLSGPVIQPGFQMAVTPNRKFLMKFIGQSARRREAFPPTANTFFVSASSGWSQKPLQQRLKRQHGSAQHDHELSPLDLIPVMASLSVLSQKTVGSRLRHDKAGRSRGNCLLRSDLPIFLKADFMGLAVVNVHHWDRAWKGIRF